MPDRATHRIVPLGPPRLPAPFRRLVVGSEEPQHQGLARSTCRAVHVLRWPGLDADLCRCLAAPGRAQVAVPAAFDIGHAPSGWAQLATLAPPAAGLPEQLSQALQRTGVLGANPADYRRALDGRVDHLVCRGAGFHNDVARHWSRCLFWVLALQVQDVELVMPHVGLRLPLVAGDLVVFDPSLAHGLCRPADGGQALPTSFGPGPADVQVFLTGELPLSDPQWAALGAPWLPVAAREPAALDLLLAPFDDRSGAIQRVQALRDALAGPAGGPTATGGWPAWVG
ncbi:MAG: hypothetical protein RJA10_800 [Pseudomonadota bacterium]|jgi:hypothetical protein